MTPREREAVLDALRSAIGECPGISFAYVHGSFLREGKFRDVDLAVYLASTPSSPLNVELKLETELGLVTGGCRLDVRILNGAPASFRYQVIKEGRPLLVKDEDARADFVEVTLRDYFDFAPFRREYLQETLGRGV